MWDESARYRMRRLKVQMEFYDGTVINVDGDSLIMEVHIQPQHLPTFPAEFLPEALTPVSAQHVRIDWMQDLQGKITFSKGLNLFGGD